MKTPLWVYLVIALFMVGIVAFFVYLFTAPEFKENRYGYRPSMTVMVNSPQSKPTHVSFGPEGMDLGGGVKLLKITWWGSCDREGTCFQITYHFDDEVVLKDKNGSEVFDTGTREFITPKSALASPRELTFIYDLGHHNFSQYSVRVNAGAIATNQGSNNSFQLDTLFQVFWR